MTFDSAVAMCRDLGIPEDAIDEVVESAELCNCGDEGPCQENSESIIKAAAELYDIPADLDTYKTSTQGLDAIGEMEKEINPSVQVGE